MTSDAGELPKLETSLAAHRLALAFALLWPTLATYGYFVLWSGDESMSLLYGAAKLLQFAFPLAWVLGVQRRRIKLQRPNVAGLLWGLGFGLCVAAAGLGAYYGFLKSSRFFAETPALVTAKLEDMGLTTPGRFFAFALFLSLPHALFEEYYWRWFTFGELRRVAPVPLAIAISSLGFMAHHVLVIHAYLAGFWLMIALLSLCVAVGGAVWAWLYHRYRSIYGPWVSHFLVDCVIMYIGYDLAVWNAASP
jgi:membrane protease YdiL (CAAX protease family)